jgi:LysM repeat protein
VALLLFAIVGITPAAAEGGYVVQAGDTLASIAQRYGITLTDLAQTNGLTWDAWVYVGQQLSIPGQSTPAAAPTNRYGSSSGVYIVQQGDTLYSIARRYGLSAAELKAANSLANTDFIFGGQQLIIPGGGQPTGYQSTTTLSTGGERWIDVNLTTQTLTAFEGQTPIMQSVVSTGAWPTQTVVGTFEIYVKYPSTTMYGGSGADYYYLPDVPNVMYFYSGYALHGTYWHNNFGTPMSHGCVNLSEPDAQWLFNWASEGTKVVTHY